MMNIVLRTLAPDYVNKYHETYVARLHAAVKDPRNKNIALTGRYGAGKSSILDQFLKEQSQKPKKNQATKQGLPRHTLRISINTLGPDDGEDLTNRIQKELVKQLVYRAKPGQLRTSRFARKPELKWWRAAIDAFAVTVVLVGLCWLFGLRPDPNSFGTDNRWLPMGGFALLVFLSAWALRWFLGRRTVSQFSTGGASIAFEENTDSYFDKYLDELFAFFEATEPDLVVFEDLDRFDDPQIFDSLRELNTLLNTSSHWQGRTDRPVRFIYAIKDSLFEKLGDKQREKDLPGKNESATNGAASTALADSLTTTRAEATPTGTPNSLEAPTPASRAPRQDAAAAASERANRTKFFEIVIPVVPFLSHSNARDLFGDVLDDLDFPVGTQISRGLLDIVARHTTDMRLMINIGNEFVVYAERLLWIPRPAPGITPDALFALVVYKNFHLADFEALPHRGSALDELEQTRREMVNACVADLQRERAEILRGETRRREHERMAASLGNKLSLLVKSTGSALQAASVKDTSLSVEKLSSPAFWKPVVDAGALSLSYRHPGNQRTEANFDRSSLQLIFGDFTSPDRWQEPISPSDQQRLEAIDVSIATLRGADFQDLMHGNRYRLEGRTFEEAMNYVLPSQLAQDLVKRGFLTRYYAEYATVFYGKFLGVDVANFYRNCVWPNESETYFHFSTENAVLNVLEQAPSDFLSTRSALNIEIVDYILEHRAQGSVELVEYLAQQDNVDTRGFLRAYLNTPGSYRYELVSRLAARPWPEIFNFLALKETAGEDSVVRLLSAALHSASKAHAYNLDDEARELIVNHHAEIPALTLPHPRARTDDLFSFIEETRLMVPDIRVLSAELQSRTVAGNRYELTANNIRAGARLGVSAEIAADNLISESHVWLYCAQNIDHYLLLVAADEFTTASCLRPEVLTSIAQTQSETWTDEQLAAFLLASSSAAALLDITVLERPLWNAVVSANRMVPNVANLCAYIAAIGVDSALSSALLNANGDVVTIGGINESAAEVLEALGVALLNAHKFLDVSQRVALVNQLQESSAAFELNVTDLDAMPDGLLGELLQSQLVPDDAATFHHFSLAGWPAIGPALKVSKTAPTFINAQLISGHAEDALLDAHIPSPTKLSILRRLEEFARDEDSSFLATAAEVARQLGVVLTREELKLIAPCVRTAEDALWQLGQRGRSLDAHTAVEILVLLGGAFAGFGKPSGHEFEVPDSSSLATVLEYLRVDGVVTFPRGRPKGRRKVRIAQTP